MKTFTNFSSFMEGCCQGIASYFGTRLPRFDSLSLVSRQSVLAILVACLTFFVGVGNAWGAGAVSMTTSVKIFPAKSTSVSQNDWATKNAPTAYSTTVATKAIDSNGSFDFYNAADFNNTNLLQLKASGGYIQTVISSPAGVDVYVGYKTTSTNNLTISLTGAASSVNVNSTSSYKTAKISTTTTSATLKLHKNSSGAAYISFVVIIPKVDAKSGNYVLVENSKDIETGRYLIVYNNSLALNTHNGNTDANTYGTYTDISSYYNSKTITANATTNALAYDVVQSRNGYCIKKVSENTFLGNTTNTTGAYLQWNTTYTSSNNEWSLGVNSIVSARNSSYAIRYYTTNPRFAIYGPSAQQPVQLFKKVEASCSANPSVGDASLNGSFNLGSIPLQASVSDDGGTGCTITDAGFVWQSGGSDPTISNNKTAGTYNDGDITGTITGSFSTGVTYKIKAYATNGHGDGLSSSSFTLIPRSVTFNLNGHGSSTPSVQYVNNGDLATDPNYSESVTGYTFGGWYDNSDWTQGTQWNFGSSTVSGGNVTLYAKWTAKTTTVSFNQNSGTGGQTGTLTATYGSAMPGAPVTCPTRTGYNFGGYYDGSGGTGTQYYTNAGASARSWDKDAATATLYAKWTAKSFTVTWMVNGAAYTPSGSGGTDGSSSVNFGTHVTTLPTAPDPGDYCGQKFMGWTTTNIGAVGQATDAGLNLFTTAGDAPVINAEGAVTYYAVFADYDE